MGERLKINLPSNLAIFLAGGAVSSLLWIGGLRSDLTYIKDGITLMYADHERLNRFEGRLLVVESFLGLKPTAKIMNADTAKDYTALKGD